MIRLRPCACAVLTMERVRRAGWMRALFPNRALYACRCCGARFLATPAQQAELGIRAFAERSGATAAGPESGRPSHPAPAPAAPASPRPSFGWDWRNRSS